MNLRLLLSLLPALAALSTLPASAELRIPGGTAYSDPDPNALRMSERENVLRSWSDPAQHALWFGQFLQTGDITASLAVKAPKDAPSKLRLSLGDQHLDASITGTGEPVTIPLGKLSIPSKGYHRFSLSSLNPKGSPTGDVLALILDGTPATDAHFNLKPRRNAASVHLSYQTPKDTDITGFYNEVTAVTDPVTTFYMACGFARGYFGMQVNSETERRIIFSVWDAAEGSNADSREKVNPENHVQLLAKGDGVEASVFGGEGTGGHSHLVYPWKTGATQKFWLTCSPEGNHTDYSGWWFHPDKNEWFRLASFRAPKDGKFLRGLHSFSENFWGTTGHLQRKALFGPQWILTKDKQWLEITSASFSHDGTGRADRTDRFMGVESNRFFLSHGGFLDGFSKFGDPFSRPASPAHPSGLPE